MYKLTNNVSSNKICIRYLRLILGRVRPPEEQEKNQTNHDDVLF